MLANFSNETKDLLTFEKKNAKRKGGAMSARFLKYSENIEKLFIERNNFYVLSMSQLLPYAALN